MPRKTKKKKLLAQNRVKAPPKEKPAVEVQKPTGIRVVEAPAQVKQIPLPSRPHQSKHSSVDDSEAARYFKIDITKTAVITAAIVVIEIVLYHLMNTGVLDKWIPAFKI